MVLMELSNTVPCNNGVVKRSPAAELRDRLHSSMRKRLYSLPQHIGHRASIMGDSEDGDKDARRKSLRMKALPSPGAAEPRSADGAVAETDVGACGQGELQRGLPEVPRQPVVSGRPPRPRAGAAGRGEAANHGGRRQQPQRGEQPPRAERRGSRGRRRGGLRGRGWSWSCWGCWSWS
ncbi:hypothetical protein MHYP_G00121490 [Metynnis hypsauchen]